MIEVYGVFEGGGVRGTALVGAVAAAEERGITFRAVAGTSAGAIVASLIAAGYKAAEMREFLTQKNFRHFKDPVNWIPGLSCVPGLRHIINWRRLGLYKGDAFHHWIGGLISLGITKRYNDAPTFEQMKIPLTVIAADVYRQQIRVLSKRQSSGMAVADAVRMSMSIPFYFTPVRNFKEVIVDGGVLSNFPAWAFDEELKNTPLPILGFRLQHDDLPPTDINNALDMARALINTVIKETTPLQISHLPNLHVIELPTLGVGTTDFDISEEWKIELYNEGYRSAQAYFDTIAPLINP